MNETQTELIEELKEASRKLGHSPKRREIPKLARGCCKHFDSFNAAKKKAGLSLKNVRILNFPANAFEKDSNLAKIASYLTFDGHVYKDLSAFYFSSKDLAPLKEFESLATKKFGVKGNYYLNNGGAGKTKTHKYIVFNKRICQELTRLGVPCGDKMLNPFDIPDWIKSNKVFSKEYLKILFYCEGSKYKQSKNTERIKINLNKSEKLLGDGINFMNSLKELLKKFNIETNNMYITKGNLRKKDGEITKQMNLYVKSSSNDKFIKEIGWLK